jgi:hypothetical protein
VQSGLHHDRDHSFLACATRRSLPLFRLVQGEPEIDELESGSGRAGSDSAGQSVGAQGLSQVAEVDEESVAELAETDQAYGSEAVEGIEDAGDRPERPALTREDSGR